MRKRFSATDKNEKLEEQLQQLQQLQNCMDELYNSVIRHHIRQLSTYYTNHYLEPDTFGYFRAWSHLPYNAKKKAIATIATSFPMWNEWMYPVILFFILQRELLKCYEYIENDIKQKNILEWINTLMVQCKQFNMKKKDDLSSYEEYIDVVHSALKMISTKRK